MPQGSQGWQFWVDRGGTFTDIVARMPDGQLATHKLLSENPERYPDAALHGMRVLMGLAPDDPFPAGGVSSVKMGTTVATNALLERRGEPTLWVVTAGFADALTIGTQARPELFVQHIVRPKPLHTATLEVTERLAADGQVVTPLDAASARTGLEQAYDQGLRSVAIAFMHADRYPAHEAAVAAIAQEVGFTQISASHRVSPLLKLVPRADTAVADAYLSPVLKRHTERLSAPLSGSRLMFMQSNGGLVEAARFAGKDAVLSGPAGGLVGAVRVAEQAGFQRIITFDMGGTSTDVAHYDGQFERDFETAIAGVRLRAPMLAIHTVAAGGGSILAFDGGRLRVGPASAGARPGPACYRAGGPLTVTDCNVQVGKLQPAYFPAVFGPTGDQPLDAAVVDAGFTRLAGEVSAKLGSPFSAEAVAQGCLDVAVETMAAAIRRISLQRGHDVARYTLVCFGAAGGQHACAIAERLGMGEILIHPFAGVLSAYGMGLADLRALRERSCERELSADWLETLAENLDDLAGDAAGDIVAQGVDLALVVLHKRLLIRYAGTDTALAVPADVLSFDGLEAAFADLHQQRFGFTMPRTPLVVEALAVEAVGGGFAAHPPTVLGTDRALLLPVATPLSHARVYTHGAWHETPVYRRESLAAGTRLHGPALVLEATGTTVVEPGWSLTVSRRLDIVLRHEQVVSADWRSDDLGHADPVRLALFDALFRAIAEDMGTTLQQTSRSVNIKERLDFSCAIFDADGDLVANAPHIPVHLGSMDASVQALRTHPDVAMSPGRVYALNNPYAGGTHLPDVTVVTPVHDAEGVLRFFVAARGHHADLGGVTPGSMPPDSTSIAEEGILIDAFLLVDDGRFREEALRELLLAGPHPVRNVEQNLADMRAQVAANARGAAELLAACERHGVGTVSAYMGHVQAHAEEAVRGAIARLAAQRTEPAEPFVVALDDGARIQARITLDAASRSATIDFTGTSAQHPGNFNAPSAICRAVALYVFRTLVDEDVPLNAGCMRPLTLLIPEGCMLAPQAPAAVVAGNVETSQNIADALYGALGVLAASQGTMNNLTFGDDTHQYYETICGGTGAGPGFPGADAVQSHMTNSRLTDPEVLEVRFPVRVDSFAIRRGSGGDGQWPGGAGVVRRLRFLAPMTAAILSGRRQVAPFGLAGGGPAQTGHNWIARADGSCQELPGCARVTVEPDDVLVIETPGGGGYGTA